MTHPSSATHPPPTTHPSSATDPPPTTHLSSPTQSPSSRAQRSALDVATTTPQRQPSATDRFPALVLGGSGYVAGELLRLLAGHPRLRPAAVLSDSKPGVAVAEVFPHLAGAVGGLAFAGREGLSRLFGEQPHLAVFCAAPHGAAALLLAELLGEAERAGCQLAVVDLSADFRFADAAAWEAVYGRPHGAPELLPRFTCALPELVDAAFSRHVAHPGCFTTAVLLAAVPLLRAGLVEPWVTAVAVTGSTGAGRTPTPTTHHPERRSTLFAYAPLAHRHQPEMEALAAAAGAPATIRFVPQAGPFARGIHATLVMRPRAGTTAAAAREALLSFYAGAPFVDVLAEPPRLQDVVGSNRCRLAVAADGEALVAFAVLDNLVKGAAGGGVQWMNRLLGFDESAGLSAPGLGWL
ncbi:MAG TPA: N-acetyl-gamma-glutamyl-phosphate reductase [Thermoanaerobaculia bacterium]|jgi:N-acetyl-gamma-glutamyl-phosphate reductase|nr:N-acetyl-gamma-glutamyl-phosphate reductase [Thermoanaerobaculia bacterium]